MIHRNATSELLNLANQYKVVLITGPRQSGKTTLVRNTFKNKAYISLENPDTRTFAQEDPRGFLAQFPEGAILDEVQRVPELFSYLQQVVDEKDIAGHFILTGSNNFLLQENITQSLAGRIGQLTLLPFCLSELQQQQSLTINEYLYKGLYPPLYDKNFEIGKWYANYIQTYIEKDVRQLKNISNLSSFEKLLRLCAGRTGQLLNMSSLAIEAGVDSKTVSSWLSVLESSFIIFRLQPHHINFNKRVVKMPKIYFYDTGIATALLGIHNASQLDNHAMRGNLFENFVVTELLKQQYNEGQKGSLFFWRDNSGHEVDVLIETAGKLIPVEIKSGQTVTTDYFKGILNWNKISGSTGGFIVYGGDQSQKRSNQVTLLPWNQVVQIYPLKQH